MNKLYYILIVCLLVYGLSACQHGSGNSEAPDASALIVGKWNLQQQKTVQYVNSVVETDTTFVVTVSSNANLQFNSNGTYNSASHYVAQAGPPYTLNNGTIVAANDTTFGTYTIANTQLKLSSIVAGFINAGFAYGTTTIATTLPTFALVSNTSQINALTSSKLSIHSEVIYTATINGITTTYKNEFDFYYSK